MEIEEVAARSPEKILRETIDPAVGIQAFQARKLAFGLGFPKAAVNKAVAFMTALYRPSSSRDASLAEINPLVLTKQGDLIALDAKMGFDDNALFRHPDIRELRDLNEEDPKEVEASKFDLNYIALDGNIGCMVNGAGLAMATMDIIKQYGGEPANFLDVGGGATTEKVTEAFKIILSDPNVKAVLVNIFGGIMKCDVIANGVVEAARAGEARAAARRAARGHQRRARTQDPGGVGAEHRIRHRHGRRRPPGRARRASRRLTNRPQAPGARLWRTC